MAAVDAIRSLQQLQQGPAGAASSSMLEPITGPFPTPDGLDEFRTALTAPSGDDLSIPLGRWTLRLVPVDQAGTARVAVRLFVQGAGGADPGAFDRVEVDIARLELISHPDDLVPADLVVDPYTHLVPNPALGTVRLLGPGLTLTLRGEGLSDLGARFTGANGGMDARFPSARFDPPHFLIGPSNGLLGFACDEVLLDLSEEIDPDGLDALTGVPSDGRFTGVVLRELGLFVGDPEEVGTWAGMARVRDFVLRFDPLEVTGRFEGELVHAVAPDDPQVEVEVTFESDGGQRVSVTEVDPTVPPPRAPARTRRVRLVATPNWASAGFQVRWTVPDGVSPEDPSRVVQPDLGWLDLPPGAHEFTVLVTDHRVDDVTETRTVIVQAPPVGATPPALTGDLTVKVVEPAGGANALHLYLPLVPQQPATVRMACAGGTGDQLAATVTLPAGWLAAESLTQTASRSNGTFAPVEWTLTTGTTASEGAFEVTATVGAETVVRRVRYTLAAPTPEGTPDLDLLMLVDWRDGDGPVPAVAVAHDGLPYDAPVWKMAAVDAPATLLESGTHDGLFADAAPEFGTDEVVALATSGGLVKPELRGPDRLYRIVADVPATTPERPPTQVLYPASANQTPVGDPAVRAMFAERGATRPAAMEHLRPNGRDAATIRFTWDSDAVLPATFDTDHEDPGTTLASVTEDQVRGFADVFRAVAALGDGLEQLGLFASASAEGTDEHNLDLSQRRLAAARAALAAPPAALVTAIGQLPGGDRLDAATVNAAAARIAALPAASVVTKAWGELNATGDRNPLDRRVFAVLRRAVPAAVPGFRRRAYALVRADAPPKPVTVPPRLPKPEQHPFRHSVFRSVHVEIDVRRNDLLRFQLRLELDVERFDENDLAPADELNPNDGIVTGFLELRRNPDPAASPRFSWELDLLADPDDVDGLMAFVKGGTGDALVGPLGGPLIALPAMAAAAGGRTGEGGLLVALAVGVTLQQVGVFDVQTLIWKGIRLRLQHGGSAPTRFSFALDYAVKYDIDVDLTGFGIPVRMQTTTPIEVGFRNVGVDVTGAFDSVELFYDPSSGFKVDVADPGVFQLGQGLGRLLRVDRVSIGDASPLWLEVELGFSLDVGIFSVDTLRIRLSLEGDKVFQPDANGVVHLDEGALDLDDLEVSINKLGVGVSVPGVIDGRGMLGIKEENGGTTVEGELSLDFESLPVLRGLDGQLKVFTSDELRALYLGLGIEFAPGLPLGSTGIAVYGLHGLLGVNMAPSDPDPLAWLRQQPVGVTSPSKWVPARGSWAFGAGATFGTVFDGGFVFNLDGTFMLQLPGPRFVLAAHAQLFSVLPDVGTSGGVLATVLLDFDDDVIVVGIDLTLTMKPVLELHVPAEAFFDLADPSNFHLRLGQWKPESKRITLRIFDLFDAWGYLQIEGRGLDNGELHLEGISIGAGARIEIEWGKKGLLYLEAYAEAHAGLQLDPLYVEGKVKVGGEIHAGPLSIGARGQLTAKARVDAPSFLVLRGEVCGSIDLWFTEITKCVDFELGDGDQPTPRPNNPFADAVAVDRMTGLPIDAGADGRVVVPIDAVFQLTFTADVHDDRPAPGVSLVTDVSVFRNQLSSALFYEFSLRSLDVRRVGGAAVAGVQSAWAPYSLVEAGTSAPQSQRTLRLFDWKPTAHPHQVDFGSATQSYLQVLFERLCDPVVPPPRRCADFDEEPLGARARWVLTEEVLSPVTVFAGAGGLGAETTASGANRARPARVVPLPAVDYPGRSPVAKCLRLGDPDPERVRPLDVVLDGLAVGKPERVKDRAAALFGTVDSVLHGKPVPPELRAWQDAGAVLIRVPPLVAVDVTLATPARFHGDSGEVGLLDDRFEPIGGAVPLDALPVVPASSTGPALPDHVVRRLTAGHPELAPAGEDPPTGRWIVIRPPAAPVVRKGDEPGSFLLEVCGVTLADWREFRRRHDDVEHTKALLLALTGIANGQPAVLGQPLLVPGAEYEVVGSLDWSRYRSRTATDDDGSSASEGGPFPVVSRRFVADPSPPADLTRYVRDHDPFDEEQPHYTDEPVVIRYASKAVDEIYAAYGRQLVIRAKADATGHVLIQPTSIGAGTTFTPLGSVESELLDALERIGERCVPGDWVNLFPLPVHTVRDPLVPNMPYTFAVFARDAAEAGTLTFEQWAVALERAFELGVGTGAPGGAVYRFDLRTSRWANLAAQVDAYRTAPVGDLFVDDPAAFAALVAAAAPGQPVRSDAVVDSWCAAAFGGPPKIPDRPEVARLWVPDGNGWACTGLLLDGPEPLLRRRMLADGGTEQRVLVEVRSAPAATTPFGAAVPVAPARVVAGTRGSRLLVGFPPGAAGASVLVGVTDRGASLAAGPSTTHVVGTTVGSEPEVFAAGVA